MFGLLIKHEKQEYFFLMSGVCIKISHLFIYLFTHLFITLVRSSSWSLQLFLSVIWGKVPERLNFYNGPWVIKGPSLKIQKPSPDRCSPLLGSGSYLKPWAQILWQLQRMSFLKLGYIYDHETVKRWDVSWGSAVTDGEWRWRGAVTLCDTESIQGDPFFRDIKQPRMKEEAAERRYGCLSSHHQRQELCES